MKIEIANPILKKEMRSRMRGMRAFVVLTCYIAMLTLILSLIYLLMSISASVSEMSYAGPMLTGVLIYVQMALICLIAPTFAAGAISAEREQQTFDLLVASLARPMTIVAGKLGASLSYLLLTLSGSLPLIATTYTMGGVVLTDIALWYTVMLVAGLTFCSIGFMWSTLTRRSVVAQLASLVTVAILVVGLPAVAIVSSSFGSGPTRSSLVENFQFLLIRINPFAAMASVSQGFENPSGVWLASVPVWVSQMVFYLVLSGLALLLAHRRLRRVREWI